MEGEQTTTPGDFPYSSWTVCGFINVPYCWLTGTRVVRQSLRLKLSLTICGCTCNYKGSMQFLLSYFETLIVGPALVKLTTSSMATQCWINWATITVSTPVEPEKFRNSMGFEPVTSQYWLNTLTNRAMRPLMLGAGHLSVQMFPWWMNQQKVIYEMNRNLY